MFSFFLNTQVEAGGLSIAGQHGPHVKTVEERKGGKGKIGGGGKKGSKHTRHSVRLSSIGIKTHRLSFISLFSV